MNLEKKHYRLTLPSVGPLGPKIRPREMLGCATCPLLLRSDEIKCLGGQIEVSMLTPIPHGLLSIALIYFADNVISKWSPRHLKKPLSNGSILKHLKEFGAKCLSNPQVDQHKVRISVGETKLLP